MARQETIEDVGALFQIEEPSEAPVQARRPGFGIGIDLGTTHSLVAVGPKGAAVAVLRDASGSGLLPSVVSYAHRGRPVVGVEAEHDAMARPKDVLRSVKRFMGRSPAEIKFEHPYRIASDSNVVRFEVGDPSRFVSAIEASAEILRALKTRAEAHLGGPVDGAVITVPAYFDEAERQATKDAARIAGLRVYRLLAEPTAAALAYGLDRGESGWFAVYDLGGGTFDVSILRLQEGIFQVLAVGGDSALGGDDLDRALATVLLADAGVSSATATQFVEAVREARRAKEALSFVDEVEVRLEHAGGWRRVVERAEFEKLAAPWLLRTRNVCKKALKDAGLGPQDLDGVVLVGGSTRIPAVRRLATEVFGRPPLEGIDPDEVVAVGAAIEADILSGSPRPGVTLLDVVPLSLGLETMGGIVEPIIPRNASIPISARQVFTNYSEKQTGMQFHVVQGERELAAQNRSLARFELRGIPQLPPSMARVEVTFQLDADALLTVTARELMTGIRQSVEVRATHGLDETEIDRLVADGLDHAEEDFAARNLAEARVELGRVVLAVEATLEEVDTIPGFVSDPERRTLLEALSAAHVAMQAHPGILGSQASALPTAPPPAIGASELARGAQELALVRKRLEAASEPLARRRMERALKSGMEGRTLGEIEGVLRAGEEQQERKRGGHHASPIDPA